MTRETKKRRRWKTVRSGSRPELILPPHIRAAMGYPVDPRWLAAAEGALVECHKRYDRGDKSAVLDAIEILSNVFFPPWLREAYIAAWAAYRQCAVESLGQAFGVTRPKGWHRKRARARELLRWQILFRAYHLHKQGAGKPLDAEMFAAIGRELGVSTSTVTRIFSESESDELRELLRNFQISDMSEIG